MYYVPGNFLELATVRRDYDANRMEKHSRKAAEENIIRLYVPAVHADIYTNFYSGVGR